MTEIRNAERTITQIRNLKAVSDFMFVLPTNNWQIFQYLFTRDFNEDELELINNFYNACVLSEEAIKRMKSYLPISSEEKIKITQHKLLDLAERHKTEANNLTQGSNYDLEKKAILDTLVL